MPTLEEAFSRISALEEAVAQLKGEEPEKSNRKQALAAWDLMYTDILNGKTKLSPAEYRLFFGIFEQVYGFTAEDRIKDCWKFFVKIAPGFTEAEFKTIAKVIKRPLQAAADSVGITENVYITVISEKEKYTFFKRDGSTYEVIGALANDK